MSKFTINGSCDLAMSHKAWIGKEVRLVKVCKSGLYLVEDETGKQTTLPKRNLDAIR